MPTHRPAPSVIARGTSPLRRIYSSIAARATLGALLVAAAWLALPGTAQAQQVPSGIALPFYNPGHTMFGLYHQWYGPQSERFENQSQQLVKTLQDFCASPATTALPDAARQQWKQTMLAWEGLSAVAMGPLIERRSMRQIDFSPVRPDSVRKAIRTAPADARAMERIGAPAKGLPALEWLLWAEPVQASANNAPGCTYALRVSQDIAAEAQALKTAFVAEKDKPWLDDEEGEAAAGVMAEWVNQWLGGLERLRWANMEKPVRSAGGKKAPVFERALAGETLNAWRAHWAALRLMAVADGNRIPETGKDVVPIETYLRGRGLNPLAQKWADAVRAADQGLQQLDSLNGPAVLAAAQKLSALKRLMEAEVAPALQVNIGFSDADGD